jgi:hypothetical protein
MLFIIALVFTVSISVEAQRRLVPCNMTHYKIWNRFFTKYYQEYARYQYLVSPSFSSPYALYVMPNNTLEVRDKDKNYKMNCDSLIHLQLSILITHATATSMYIYDRLGLDGTRYFFFDYDNGATCWSPSKYSTCDSLVRVMENVIKAVKTRDNVLLQSQKPIMDSLISTFKKYYPEDYGYVGGSWEPVSVNGKISYNVFLYCYDETVKLNFLYPKEKYNQSTIAKLKSQYGKVLQEAAKWAFMNTYAMDLNGIINITIDNSSPFKFQKSRKKYEFTIQETDMNTDNLIRLFKEYLQ